MKPAVTLFSTLLLCISSSYAQHLSPGGVTGAVLWATAAKDGNKLAFQVSTPEGSFSIQAENSGSTFARQLDFNFNPALFFNGIQTPFSLPLGHRDLSKMTICTVLHPADSLTEKSIWFFEKNAATNLLFTTHRIADLKESLFMNFLDGPPRDDPFVNVYDRFDQRDSIPAMQNLVIGAKPASLDAPINAYKGLMAELIIYDRVLSPGERQRVETYLALKYGIALSPSNTACYVNSTGKTILHGQKSGKFHHRITGIGRDDGSNLYQKQSSSSYEPGLLVVGASQITTSNSDNTSVLSDNSYLIWADNDDRLDFAPKTQGRPQFIARKWLMTRYGAMQNTPTMLHFDTRKMMSAPLKKGEIWWLAVDRSGTGKFEAQDVEYYPQFEAGLDGKVVFKDIYWDTDGSATDWFALGTAPAMMGKAWVEQPTCVPFENGILLVGAEGGKPPYSITVKSNADNFSWQGISYTSELISIPEIPAGDYQLNIKDDAGHVFYDSIYVESSDAPVSNLAPNYLLLPGKPLLLDAAVGIIVNDLDFQWIGPEGFFAASSKINITAPGTYQLIIGRDGCTSRRNIIVNAWEADNFVETNLFPNPAKDGRFEVMIRLHRNAPVNMVITDAGGRIINAQTLQDRDYYKHPVKLSVSAGIYFVSISSEQTKKVFQVVVD